VSNPKIREAPTSPSAAGRGVVTPLIPAEEALQEPSAKLTPEDEAAIEKLVLIVNDAIKNKKVMKRNGFQLTTDCNNPVAVFEFTMQLQDAHYSVNCQPILVPNRLNPNGPPRHEGYMLGVIPTKEAIQAAKKMLLS